MFQTLWQVLKQRNLLMQSLERSEQALEISERVTRAALGFLLDQDKPDFDLYEMDQKINAAEVDIRRMVFEHMNLNPGGDITPGLILTSVIIDIERIGDYAKNIYEQGILYGEPIGTGGHGAILREIAADTLSLFERTSRSVSEGDTVVATEVMKQHRSIGQACENLIADITTTDSLRTKEAVVLVLTARFLKRVSAHLSNLASSVVNPFDRIGFRPGEGSPVDAD